MQANPPISKGSTPVAGQVKWARSLFARCRLTMGKVLQLQPDLTSQALGLQVSLIGVVLLTSALLSLRTVYEGGRKTRNNSIEEKVSKASETVICSLDANVI